MRTPVLNNGDVRVTGAQPVPVKLSQIIPPTPGDVADWSDVAELQKRMADTVAAMALMASDVGAARHVSNYDSDRRKRALARAMSAALAGGESAAKAEAEARASENYGKELAQLGREDMAAEQVIAEWDALKIVWESCRSLLSMQRETVKHL